MDNVVLRSETVDRLQGLIDLNIDSAKGWRLTADRVENQDLARAFREAADTREGFARELQQLVASAGDRPRTGGTALGTAHRWWLNLRGTVAKGDEHALLAEAERGESAITSRYEEAMRDVGGQPAREVLQRHYDSIKRTHETVRAMRDAAGAGAPPLSGQSIAAVQGGDKGGRAVMSDRDHTPHVGSGSGTGTGASAGSTAGGSSKSPSVTGSGTEEDRPVSVGAGTAVGGTVGGIVGSVAGPAGTVAGTAIGGVAGGLVGKAISEAADPDGDDYWRSNFASRPYAKGRRYEDYAPAYRYGTESASRYRGRPFDEVQGDLERDWNAAGRSTSMTWESAKDAVRDAWDRITSRRSSGTTPGRDAP